MFPTPVNHFLLRRYINFSIYQKDFSDIPYTADSRNSPFSIYRSLSYQNAGSVRVKLQRYVQSPDRFYVILFYIFKKQRKVYIAVVKVVPGATLISGLNLSSFFKSFNVEKYEKQPLSPVIPASCAGVYYARTESR